ncbi:MAG TPA: hypothetical protein VLF94_06190 [Chlamydiales bacterium]|nr:hypothetical protein [Chlamydiales bacterium]
MESLEPPTFIQMLQNKRREIAIGTAAVIGGVAILIGYFQSGPDAASYAQAEAALAKWKAAPEDDALYGDMKAAVRSAPALGRKHEAAIAQKLMNTEKITEALGMANRSIERVKDEAPLHSEYARTSLLIEQGSYQQALENAVALKEQLAGGDVNSVLYAHNLLRIACLQQELKNRPGEKAAWEELETFLKGNSHSEAVLANFSNRNVDLTQYINERKKGL